MRDPHHVAIIGGGFSGVALAAELARRSRERLDVTLIESGDRLGRGVAYGTPCASHLLNTRAGQMSAFADDPEHFLRWRRRGGHAARGSEFVARRDYGEYLEHALREACRNTSSRASLTVHLQTHATDLTRTAAGFDVVLSDGRTLHADTAVLATGHPAPADPFAGALPADAARYVRDPWQREAIAAIAPDERVLVLGTGLTAVDIMLALDGQGHRGTIDAMSRHGLLPRTHCAQRQVLPRDLHDALLADLTGSDLRRIVRAVRRSVTVAEHAGFGWHAVLDALRPAVARIWIAMCARDRRQFVRWLRPYWDVHRHRLPPAPAARIAELSRASRLTIRAGRVRGAAVEDGGSIAVELAPRGCDELIRRRYDWVINCTGSSFAKRASRPLERRLLEHGLLLSDPLDLGYVTDEDGAAIGAHGPVTGLYVLGPGCRPSFWEHTAVPELRAQACSVAANVLARSTERLDPRSRVRPLRPPSGSQHCESFGAGR